MRRRGIRLSLVIIIIMLVAFAPATTASNFTGSATSQAELLSNPGSTTEPQSYESRPNNYYTDISVGYPQNASDDDFATKAYFTYSSGTGVQKGLELYNFTSPVGPWSSLAYAPLPTITQVDFNMRYNVSENLGDRNDYYRIVYSVNPDTTAQVLTDWRNDYTTDLYVNGFDASRRGWIGTGTSPYLGAVDYPTDYARRAVTVRPDGDGSYTGYWSGAYTDWYDVTPDGNGTYVSATANDLNETSTLANPVPEANWYIESVALTIVAAQYGGNEEVRLMLLIGGQAYNGTMYRPTGIYTRHSSNWFTNPSTGSYWTWSDINDLEAGVRSDQAGVAFEGEIRVTQMYLDVFVVEGVTVRPDGDGFYTAWGGTTGTYTDWDDVTPDGESTYVSAGSSNLNESSTLANPPAATWIIGSVRVTIVARQTTGDEKVRIMVVIGGSGYNGSLVTPTSSYASYCSEWFANPATESAWTWSDINDLEAGVRSQQNDTTFDGELRITQMYVDVLATKGVVGDFEFQDLGSYDGGQIELQVYARGDGDDSIDLYLYDQTEYVLAGNVAPLRDEWSWLSIEVTSIIDTLTKINGIKAYLDKKVAVEPGNLEVDAMRLKVYNFGFVDIPTTVTWEDQAEPNNGVWNWTDINNIRFAVETSVTGTGDSGCLFYEFEAWVTVYSPPAQLSTRPLGTLEATSLPQTATLRPDADTGYAMWGIFPAAPTTHYDKVDEPVQNGDTDYIYATSTNLRDYFDIEDPVGPPAWTIGAVRVVAYAEYTAASDERLFLGLRIGVPYVSAPFTLTVGAYQKYSYDWSTNPATLNPWTWSEINTLQAGVQVLITGSWTGQIRVTQLYVEVIESVSMPVDIEVEGAVDLWGFDLTLSYDTSILTAVQVEGVNPFTSAQPSMINDAQGWVKFGYSMTFGITVGAFGNVTAGRVIFTPDAIGTSVLDLYDTKLTDTKAGSKSHDIVDRDVEVTAVTPTATLAYQGYPRNITVTVESEATVAYDVNVTCFYNSSLLDSKILTGFASGASTTFNLTWVTTGVPYGDYEITVSAILEENDVSTLSGGMMRLTIPGDVNGNKDVTIADWGIISDHWTGVGLPYLLEADVDESGSCGIGDWGIASDHWYDSPW